MKYLVVVEPTSSGFSAYSPDIPGCVATGETLEEAQHEIVQAISFHIEGMRLEGLSIPEPSSSSIYVDVPA